MEPSPIAEYREPRVPEGTTPQYNRRWCWAAQPRIDWNPLLCCYLTASLPEPPLCSSTSRVYLVSSIWTTAEARNTNKSVLGRNLRSHLHPVPLGRWYVQGQSGLRGKQPPQWSRTALGQWKPRSDPGHCPLSLISFGLSATTELHSLGFQPWLQSQEHPENTVFITLLYSLYLNKLQRRGVWHQSYHSPY